MAVTTTPNILRKVVVMIPPTLRNSGAYILAMQRDRPADLIQVSGQIAKLLANRPAAPVTCKLAAISAQLATV
ncbi:hypothetical protein RA2_03762 [Roseovarius sp. A-2]|uniref:hypothetical protein n=1 Tax=Roseovarius sp. A-2 TaxID=1570360 RepID=UPI0009C48D12|nr:hypothetical protein [Roseovarius sp. A-2]GAW36687.1 hypothetical protein RA2_03762 [Roseovarius sp. A-2]